MKYAIPILVALLLSAGQVMFKKAAILPSASYAATLFSGWTIAAVALFGLATALWLWLLRTTALSAAYPFIALSFLFVPLAARFVLGEPLDWRFFAGSLLIVTGIVVTNH